MSRFLEKKGQFKQKANITVMEKGLPARWAVNFTQDTGSCSVTLCSQELPSEFLRAFPCAVRGLSPSLCQGRGVAWGELWGLPCSAEPCCVLAEKEEIEHPNNSFSPCSIHDRKCLQKQQAKRVNNGNKMRSSGSPHPREETRPIAQGSCQSELHRALERLAASQTRTHEDLYVIPIPNCDRNGNFHPKQCHPALDGQRGKCWCVDRKTGVKLPGFLELKGDLDCHQPADSM
ncbi:insulin-like growth factor-binding protein 4 [Meleagris gallopavo]|uniref:insulin-like growth factor-binding protein 4 n=1 Tax=Meleagris gallopavo TaxID=9103 RepID=UPI000549C35A|nr:insulin-like growth factor-binding protein 4 [Meleagris gallopavo]